ncbi:DUF3052 domain-containing protein [Streptomyces beihaiensis]|uniref:DUF3052 domain-containing protein n=1 Tax=Streptomyces beihaiensis TaxID=2984495 RepID=A0ABT3TTA3_9ACTN|nr:DUF3052 domain-containing protein [Streptomyces beihaiensis]MCX3060015.1 DUF3052 domain-containing protein [Streptomyces beihaiensis]
MSATADHADTQGLVERLGFAAGQVVQEIGYDDDVDMELRESIEKVIGEDGELVDEDYDDVADAVVLWFREDDGDLTDALVDAIAYIEEGGPIVLLTPKTGRDGYVEPSEVSDAANTAGLTASKSVSVGKDWSGSRLATPKAAAAKKR